MTRRDDDVGRTDRDRILARRRLFVASAVAGLAATLCDVPPFVCLSPPPSPDAGGVSPPAVCLAVPVSADAGAESQTDASLRPADASANDGSAE